MVAGAGAVAIPEALNRVEPAALAAAVQGRMPLQQRLELRIQAAVVVVVDILQELAAQAARVLSSSST